MGILLALITGFALGFVLCAIGVGKGWWSIEQIEDKDKEDIDNQGPQGPAIS